MGRFSLKVDEATIERFKAILFVDDIASALFKDVNDAKSKTNKLLDEKLQCYLLTNGEQDIGIGAFYVFEAIKKAIVDIGALKKFRGKRVKIAALDALEEFLKEHESFEVFAYIKNKNRKSLYFSHHVGFKTLRKINGDYIMRLDHGKLDRKYV